MVAVLESEFFLSEILGRKVYLKSERIGRLDDFVIVETGKLPEISHLVVVRPFGYPSLLLPWDKIGLISNTEIVADVVNVTDYEKPVPDSAILLKAHILDKKILDMDGHEVEVVYDVKLVLQHDRLYASEVDFSRNRLLRRMGLKKIANFFAESQELGSTVSWLYVQPLPEKIGMFRGHVKLNVLKENIHDIHPVDLADILEELEGDQRLAVFNELEPELASDTLEEVEPRVQRELIGGIEKERAAQLIDEMSPAQAADVLAVLPAADADELLKLIDQDSAPKVQRIIDKHDESVLLYATQSFIKLPPTTLAREVIEDYRRFAREKDIVMYVYVVDAADTLLGVVDLRELIAADDAQTLASIMTDNVIALHPDETLRDALEGVERYGFRAIPVVGEDKRMLGVVAYRDIRGIKPRLD
ncbi:MAG TPA: CBS domain-containing protein [Rhodocyclaceae bacterium]|nr:CBS domain-containing protein [Rhodocyclaceae bacterium]